MRPTSLQTGQPSSKVRSISNTYLSNSIIFSNHFFLYHIFQPTTLPTWSPSKGPSKRPTSLPTKQPTKKVSKHNGGCYVGSSLDKTY
mmetsp:Transcript_14956/g.32448  ORF Transcript_14956/g.32448 Transcript_14956/m.32448 type:complete len:87 (-) Transcript_14956:31-291(-)